MDLFKTPFWRALEWAESHGLFYVAGALILAVFAGIGVKRTRDVRREWQAFALRHGLEYEPPGTFIEMVRAPADAENGWPYGRVHGAPSTGISLVLRSPTATRSAGIGKTPSGSSSVGAVLRLRFDGIPEGLHVTRKAGYRPGVVDRFRAAAGVHAVDTGDAAFDRACDALTPNVEAARAYLTSTRREALLRLSEKRSWALTRMGLSVSWSRADVGAAELDAAYSELMGAAHALAR